MLDRLQTTLETPIVNVLVEIWRVKTELCCETVRQQMTSTSRGSAVLRTELFMLDVIH